ncbi:hypothetical protein [Streptomyces aidingensis]|uniref:REase associating with pPIWI RE domain-containing protein n=1 Tax=Streptomyces aidingensis TaxID=910347 RepID=A0A1I1MCZ4_9ACTN|nr:hypothetical protein [Streptomyces aidingensis]SFC82722.1 hypothetical protein SAMN05421773_106182 [Streptomyces aidingensis]
MTARAPGTATENGAGDEDAAGTGAENFFAGEPLLRLVATAMVRLSQQRTVGDPVYEDSVQQAYNHIVLHCLRRGAEPPGSVPELARWAAEKPLGAWDFGLPEELAPEAGTHLVDAATGSPTQSCLEWAVSARDPAAEQFENLLMKEALAESRAADAPEAYVAFRRLLIEKPVLTETELAALSADLDLGLLHETVKRCYERAPASCLRDGRYTACGRCGCLLVPVPHGGFRCELDVCRRSPVRQGISWTPADGGGLRHLSRPLRTFITGPGLAETALESALARAGLTAEMWPRFDTYDLRVTFPDGQVWAIDVKDRANPALLGRDTRPLRQDPPYDRGLLVVPQYRFTERDGYREVFRHHVPEEAADRIELLSDRELLRQVRTRLRGRKRPERTRKNSTTGTRGTTGKGAEDA